MTTIAIIIANIISVVLIIAFILRVRQIQHINKTSLSFKESLDLAELPIITLYCGENKVNFLIDTGSNNSFIASKFTNLLEDAPYKPCEVSVAGYEGVHVNTQNIFAASFRYKSSDFIIELTESESLSQSFEHIKKECGVQIHGIIGNKFLEKHKYIIDFSELMVYKK